MVIIKYLFSLIAMQILSSSLAAFDSYQFTSIEQEQRFFKLTNELRCPKFQNQTIADSNAVIAQDLRREIHQLLIDGADDQKVIDFMLNRYGDFVLYRPRLNSKTAVLWFGPLILLLIGFGVILIIAKKHKSAAIIQRAEEPLTVVEQKKLEEFIGQKTQEKP
ncbi:MAG: cytochrome c-type biogenesis protein CcmH [Candidatus Endonucleobacter bathymodioli]|uniref:Cytochrome c-type biogenesis protein n=1 Tax=Candidatus Endonucleibacter bathymodioli TaxID=539814 RepID=A0AA90NL97_9GAMM|nr:cytochrome c-type biogenesis protein CcmH [Candidatus Endonucleobacter bathymodioli]